MELESDYIDPKVQKYETFLNEKLKNDLKATHEARDKLYQEIVEYVQLKQLIDSLRRQQQQPTSASKKNILKTRMDLGCNFYAQAVVPDCSRIYVCVGYGYYLEMTLDEAYTFVEQKIKLLTQKSQMYHKDSAKIKAHIRLVMEALREIQHLNVTDKSSGAQKCTM